MWNLCNVHDAWPCYTVSQCVITLNILECVGRGLSVCVCYHRVLMLRWHQIVNAWPWRFWHKLNSKDIWMTIWNDCQFDAMVSCHFVPILWCEKPILVFVNFFVVLIMTVFFKFLALCMQLADCSSCRRCCYWVL